MSCFTCSGLHRTLICLQALTVDTGSIFNHFIVTCCRRDAHFGFLKSRIPEDHLAFSVSLPILSVGMCILRTSRQYIHYLALLQRVCHCFSLESVLMTGHTKWTGRKVLHPQKEVCCEWAACLFQEASGTGMETQALPG